MCMCIYIYVCIHTHTHARPHRSGGEKSRQTAGAPPWWALRCCTGSCAGTLLRAQVPPDPVPCGAYSILVRVCSVSESKNEISFAEFARRTASGSCRMHAHAIYVFNIDIVSIYILLYL